MFPSACTSEENIYYYNILWLEHQLGSVEHSVANNNHYWQRSIAVVAYSNWHRYIHHFVRSVARQMLTKHFIFYPNACVGALDSILVLFFYYLWFIAGQASHCTSCLTVCSETNFKHGTVTNIQTRLWFKDVSARVENISTWMKIFQLEKIHSTFQSEHTVRLLSC